MLVEDFAGRRQADPARRSLEQADAESTFKIGNLLADLCTSAIQTTSGGSHAAGLDDLDEAVPSR